MYSLTQPAATLLCIAAGLALTACGQAESQPRVQHLDVASYVQDMNVNPEQAAHRLDLQERAGLLEQRLRQQEKGTFAGVWIEHKPRFRVIVQTTAEEPEEERRMRTYVPQNAPLAPSINVRRVNTSLEQLVTAQDSFLRTARDLGVRFETILDIRENRVEVEVLDREAFRSALRRKGLQLPKHVEVVQVKELTVPQADLYGGVSITTCTAGWPVRSPAGVLGIATAAHCGNTQRHASVLLPFQAESQSGSCDVQWHTAASFTVVPKFIGTGPGNIRPLTGTKPRSSQVVGGYVCKYGKITGYRCGEISTKNASLGYVKNSNSTFIRVRRINKLLSDNGDSGGPWFNGNTAYGIHSGGTSQTAVYTAINYVPTCVGVNVLTQ